MSGGIRANMLHAGLSPLATREVAGNGQYGQTAAGTNSATAFPLLTQQTEFTTTGSGTGARLRGDLGPGESQLVFNGGSNALLVYPPTGGKINAGTTDAGFSVGVGKSAEFFCLDNLNFRSFLSA